MSIQSRTTAENYSPVRRKVLDDRKGVPGNHPGCPDVPCVPPGPSLYHSDRPSVPRMVGSPQGEQQ